MTQKIKTSQKGSEDKARDRLRDRRGQMLLVVILVMVVSLTIGLSVASRTITNLKISKENEESQRAFQAAEAGIEIARKVADKALKTGAVIQQGSKELSNNARYTTDPPRAITSDALNDDKPVMQDRGIDVWLIPYDQFIGSGVPTYYNGNVTIAWQTDAPVCSGANASAAIEVFILQSPLANPTITKLIYDYAPCGARVQGSGVSASLPAITRTLSDGSTVTYQHRADIPVAAGIIMKVIPLFNSNRMYAEGAGLPTQGYVLTSTGSSGETVRKLEYFESNPELPIEMFYSILSQ